MTFRQTWEAAHAKALEAHKRAQESGLPEDAQAFIRACQLEKRAREAFRGKGRI